jgi:hypothetical protein
MRPEIFPEIRPEIFPVVSAAGRSWFFVASVAGWEANVAEEARIRGFAPRLSPDVLIDPDVTDGVLTYFMARVQRETDCRWRWHTRNAE